MPAQHVRDHVAACARRTMRLVLPSTAVILSLVGCVYLVAPPIQPGLPHALSAFGTVVALLAVYGVLWRFPHTVHPVSFAGALVILTNTLSYLVLTNDPTQTVTLVIMLLGTSFCVLVPANMVALVVLTLGCWGWLARDFAGPTVAHWGMNLVVSSAIAVVVAVTRRRAAEAEAEILEQLRDREQHHRLVVENALDAVVTSDIDGRIVGWNAQALRVFGWTADEAIGRTLMETVVVPEHRDPYREALATYRRTRIGMPLGSIQETELIRRDGSRFPVEFATVAIQRGAHVVFNAWIRDITQRRHAVAAMEAAAKAKSDFLANMSHEIRTPIHGIIGMTDIALDVDDDSERREVLHRARACAETLLAIVNDVLDFSKIDAGKLDVEEKPMWLTDVLDGVLDTVAAEAEHKNLVLIGSVDPSTPTCVAGDAKRLRQILLNLVGNALKFTTQGEIEVRVEPARVDPDGTILRMVVRDTGVGIAPDRLHDIFDAFTQVDQHTPSSRGGTGLGLAISRHLAELMGGTLDVVSVEGSGSMFTVVLPATIVDAPAFPEPDVPPGLRVMLVDDHPVRRARMAEQLNAWGCTVTDDGAHDVAIVDAAVVGGPTSLGTAPIVGMAPLRWGPARSLDGREWHAVVKRPVRPSRLRAVLSSLPYDARQSRTA